MEQSNIAIFLYEEQDWEKTKQEAQVHLGLTSPCFSISHSGPMQFSIMEEQYLYSCYIHIGTALQHLHTPAYIFSNSNSLSTVCLVAQLGDNKRF